MGEINLELKIVRYILLFLALTTASLGYAQQNNRATINMKSWRAFPVYVGDSTYIAMVGNVLCYHNGAVITCDSAVQFSRSKAAFFGDVLINRDNTFIYGDRATYDGNTNTARIYSPLIKMRDGDAVMYTYNFSFDTRNNVGRFWGGATISQKQTQLEADRGYFYTKTNNFICGGAAELRDTTYLIRSDSMGYNTDTEIATFYAKTYIWNNDGDILSANRGTYHSPTEHYTFADDAYIFNGERELWADDIDFDGKREDAILKGNIQILDHEQKVLGYGDAGRYWGVERNVMLTEDPSVVSFDPEQGDSIYMRADSMWLYTLDSLSKYHTAVRYAEAKAEQAALDADEQEEVAINEAEAAAEEERTAIAESAGIADITDPIYKDYLPSWFTSYMPYSTPPDSIEAEIATDSLATDIPPDSLMAQTPADDITPETAEEPEPERVILGYRNVKIFRNDFQAKCDSLISFSIDSTIHLHLKPVVWNENNQINSEVVDVFTRNQVVDRALFSGGKPIMVQEIDTAHYNQVTGKTIEALFREGEIYRVNAEANAQTYYYIQDEKTEELQSFLSVESADITFLIVERAIDKIIWRENPVFKLYPMDMIPADNTQRLDGFEWYGKLRPMVKEEVCNRIERPSQIEAYRAIETPTFPITARINEYKQRLMRTTRWRDRRDVLTAADREFIRQILSGTDLR